jgi:RepB DNA-primase from phage plasmid/CHC2 zinc finger
MTDAAARRRRSAVDRDARVLTAFLALLVARERGGLLEVRVRRAEGGMVQRFHRAGRLREAAGELLDLGARTDVYVGCAPRLRLAGDRSSLGQAWALWVDCDGDASVARLAQFVPAPAVVVRSGSATNVHAYWPLERPLAPDEATAANRRLAELLAADGRSADATRILRAPGTRNFKHDPPRAVVLERFKPARRFTVAEVVGTTAMGTSTPASASAEATASVGGDDPLRGIPPGVYVPALTGQSVGRDGKVSCPFHEDRTPSLHLYERPEQGWYCFGCGRGGSIYDLAAELYGLLPRGRGFLRLRVLLEQRFPDWAPPGRVDATP